MQKIIWILSIAILATVFVMTGGTVALAEDFVQPLARYDFSDGTNPGADSYGRYDLTTLGSVTKTADGVSFDGESLMYLPVCDNRDMTDIMTEFTVSLWAKRQTISAAHSFMLSTGVANSLSGVAIGHYAGNDAAIFVAGNVGGSQYHANFKMPSDTAYYGDGSFVWTFYALRIRKNVGSYSINGGNFDLTGIGNGGIDIANLNQTFTLGGIVSNDGSNGYWYYNGEIADVRIYDSYLSDGQMQQLYSAGKNGDVMAVTAGENTLTSVEQPECVVAASSSEADIFAALNGRTVTVTDGSGVKLDAYVNWYAIEQGETTTVKGIPYVPGYSNFKGLEVEQEVLSGGVKPVTLNTTFTDGAVLQRDAKVRIFGYGGEAGDRVEVTFGSQRKETTVDENGWSVYLDEMQANAKGAVLTVEQYAEGSDSPVTVLNVNDVVVGEVWLASGQSNMAITYNYIYSKDNSVREDYLTYDNYDRIRVYNHPYRDSLSEPVADTVPQTTWQKPQSLTDIYNYSAFATAFCLQLAESLGSGVPIGIYISAVGGSCIEEWIDEETMTGLESTAAGMNKVDSRYFNNMIYNAVGYTIRGILWYQGEANVLTPELYSQQFEAYVGSYRKLFGNENLPVISMQLPQYCDWVSWKAFREMQRRLTESIGNLYVVCGIDLGDNTTPHSVALANDCIHPADKWEFAKRACGAAKKYVYGLKAEGNGAYGLSPVALEAVATGDCVSITFSDSTSLSGQETVRGFEVLTANGWEEAAARIEGNKILLDNCFGAEKVRYLQADTFADDGYFVYNEYGLPVFPFESLTVGAEKIKVTVVVEGSGGSFDGTEEYFIESGGTVKFGVTTEAGYRARIYENGSEVYFNGKTFESRKLYSDTIIGITFEAAEREKYSVTVRTDGNAEVTPTTVSVSAGSAQTFEITLSKGYVLSSVTINGREISVEGNSFMLSDISADTEIEVKTVKAGGCKGGISLLFAAALVLAGVRMRR